MVIIEDMNARGDDSEVEAVVGNFSLSGVNEYGRKLIEMCAEKRLSVEIRFLRKMISISLHGQVERGGG